MSFSSSSPSAVGFVEISTLTLSFFALSLSPPFPPSSVCRLYFFHLWVAIHFQFAWKKFQCSALLNAKLCFRIISFHSSFDDGVGSMCTIQKARQNEWETEKSEWAIESIWWKWMLAFFVEKHHGCWCVVQRLSTSNELCARNRKRNRENRRWQKKKKQISENSFRMHDECKWGRKFNSFCLFYRISGVFENGCCCVLFTANIFVRNGSKAHRASWLRAEWHTTEQEECWLLVNEFQMKWKRVAARHICAKKEPLSFVLPSRKSNSCHNPRDKLEHIYT